MKLSAATLAAAVLSMASCGLLWWADEATDPAAIAAGTGLVVAGALLGLTLLAWRWRRGGASYVATVADVDHVQEPVAGLPAAPAAGRDEGPRAAAR